MSVLSHLTNTAERLVLSWEDRLSIDASINTLKNRLNAYFPDLVSQIQFGSSTRGTILSKKYDSNSDIDYMIVFKNEDDYKPQTFIDRLRRFATKYYSTSQIKQSHPTIVLTLNHIKFDLVPAYEDGFLSWKDLYIPAPSTEYTEWMETDPNGFNKSLTEKNQNNKSMIKPMIRLMKYWNAVNGYVFNSYELEKSIVNAIYIYKRNLKEYFFEGINDLSSYGLSIAKTNKIDRAKRIVENVEMHEKYEELTKAENEIKKLIPPVY